MIEILRDPLWQSIGAVIALIAIFAAFLIYSLQRQKKRLAFELISENQLLTVREELDGKLKVLYENQPTNDIHFLEIKVSNIGNVAISSNDYERSLSFSTGSSSKILSDDVTQVEPKSLDVKLEIYNSKITLEPILLNPQDSLTIKCLVSDYTAPLNVDARIIGISKIEDAGKLGGHNQIYTAISILFIFIGIILVLKYDKNVIIPDILSPESKVGFFLMVIGYIGITFFFFTKKNNEIIKKFFKSIH